MGRVFCCLLMYVFRCIESYVLRFHDGGTTEEGWIATAGTLLQRVPEQRYGPYAFLGSTGICDH